jgi:hypothetical protein
VWKKKKGDEERERARLFTDDVRGELAEEMRCDGEDVG